MTLNELIEEVPLIAILRGLTPERAVDVGSVLLDAGFRCLEVPMNSPAPLDSIRLLARHFGDRAIVGAGTVLDEEAVESLALSGARIIVSPNCDTAVIRATKAAGMISIPGFFTPSEAYAAIAAGADALKLFPSNMSGCAGLSAMTTVLPSSVPIFAVGGVDHQSMQEWHAAGARGFGLGSALFKPERTLEDLSRRATEIVRAWRDLRDPAIA